MITPKQVRALIATALTVTALLSVTGVALAQEPLQQFLPVISGDEEPLERLTSSEDDSSNANTGVFLPYVVGEGKPYAAPENVQGTVELPPATMQQLDAAIRKGKERLFPSTHYAVTSRRDLDDTWSVISILGLGGMEKPEEWNLFDHHVETGLAILRWNGEQVDAVAFQGTKDFSDFLKQIPDNLVSPEAKQDLDPFASTAAVATEYVFPWKPGTCMQYGPFGVHDNDFCESKANTCGWKAVDFVSNTSGGTWAPRTLYASARGTVSYRCTCSGCKTTALKIGNLMYTHPEATSTTVRETDTVQQRQTLGELWKGIIPDYWPNDPKKDGEPCGWTNQGNDKFHVHFGFLNTGSLTIEGWTLNLNDQLWRKGNQVVKINETLCSSGDTIGPEELYIDGPAPNQTISGKLIIEGWAVDKGSGIDHVEIWLNGKFREYAQYGIHRPDLGGNVGYRWDGGHLAPGQYTILVRAFDKAGNTTDRSRKVNVVDKTPPEEAYVDRPSNNATIKGKLTVSGWAVDKQSGVDRIEILLDGKTSNATYGINRPDLGGNVGYNWETDTKKLANGEYTIRVRFYDKSGNHRSIYRKIVVQNIVPRPPTHLSPANSAALKSPKILLKWQDGGDVQSAETEARTYSVVVSRRSDCANPVAGVGQKWKTGTSYSQTSWTTPNLGDAKYYWCLFAHKGSVGSGWSGARNFTVDTTAPVINSFVINGGAGTTYDTLVELQNSATDAGTEVKEMRASVDNSTWTSWQTHANSMSYTLQDATQGDVTVYFQVRDAAGNVSATASDKIFYDPNPPRPQSASFRLLDSAAVASGVRATGASFILASAGGQATGSELIDGPNYEIMPGYVPAPGRPLMASSISLGGSSIPIMLPLLLDQSE